jgi:hypothetical protein
MPGPANVPFGNAANIFLLQFAVAAGSALSAPTATERSYTVLGVRLGDVVLAIKPTFQSGVAIAHARVSAADTVNLTIVCTNGTPTLTAENYFLLVIRPAYDNPVSSLPLGIG